MAAAASADLRCGGHRALPLLDRTEGRLPRAALLRCGAERAPWVSRMVDVAHARVVAILTRAPSAGGKSRLFAERGRPYDPHLLEALLLDTIDGVASDGVRCVVAVTPSTACDEVAALTAISVMPQIDGDLGERMRAVMTQLLTDGARAVALVGSAVPTVTPYDVSAGCRGFERELNPM